MNFSPNASSYVQILGYAEDTASHCYDVRSVKFEINSEEDISYELASLEKQVVKSSEKAEDSAKYITSTTQDLIINDFDKNLKNYLDLSKVFFLNNLYDLFDDEVSGFPWSEWLELDEHAKFHFGHMKDFFLHFPNMDKKSSEYYFDNAYDMLTSIQQVSYKKSSLFLSQFLELTPTDVFEEKQEFIKVCLQNKDLCPAIQVLFINDKFSAFDDNFKTQLLDNLKITMSNQGTCEKFIDFLITNPLSQSFYISRDEDRFNKPLKNIKWNNLEKLITFDLEKDLNLSSKLFEQLIPIIAKENKYSDKLQELISYCRSLQLEKKLETKDSDIKALKI